MVLKRTTEDAVGLKDFQWSPGELNPTEQDYGLWKEAGVDPKSIVYPKIRSAYEAYLKKNA